LTAAFPSLVVRRTIVKQHFEPRDTCPGWAMSDVFGHNGCTLCLVESLHRGISARSSHKSSRSRCCLNSAPTLKNARPARRTCSRLLAA
jgi:hypothetical protein